jgi:hypothetical protein
MAAPGYVPEAPENLLRLKGRPRMGGEEVEQLAAPDLAAEHRSPALICSVGMKKMLGDIETDCGNF